MKSVILNVPRNGLTIDFIRNDSESSNQVVLVLPDGVVIKKEERESESLSANQPIVEPIVTVNGFPPRNLTEKCIIQILREHGRKVKISNSTSGWNIYDEIAARLGVSIESRRRVTKGTGEPAWRPEVGFTRKNLVEKGILEPTEVSGRGVWQLKEEYLQRKEKESA